MKTCSVDSSRHSLGLKVHVLKMKSQSEVRGNDVKWKNDIVLL